MTVLQRIQEDWERRAEVDAEWWTAPGRSHHELAGEVAALRGGLAERLGADARVLDLGCGDGSLTRALAADFGEVVGVDVSPSMVAAAVAAGGGARYLRSSGADLGGAEGGLDAIVSTGVLPHTPPSVVDALLAAVSRALRDGGTLRHAVWLGPTMTPAEADTLTVRVEDAAAVTQRHARAGLTLVEPLTGTPDEPTLIWIEARRTHEPQPTPPLPEAPEAAPLEQRMLEYDIWLYRAGMRAEVGDDDGAEAALQAATQVIESRPEAWMQWAMHRLHRDDLKGAALLLEQLTDLRPEDPLAWFQRAQVAEAREAWPEARAALAALDALPVGLPPALAPDVDALRSLIPPA